MPRCCPANSRASREAASSSVRVLVEGDEQGPLLGRSREQAERCGRGREPVAGGGRSQRERARQDRRLTSLGIRSSSGRKGRSRSDRPANGSSDSVSNGRVRTTLRWSVSPRTLASSAVFPTPGSPCRMQGGARSVSRARASSPPSAAASSALPTSTDEASVPLSQGGTLGESPLRVGLGRP